MTIATRELGHGLTVSAQGFGAMALAGTYGEADPEQSLAVLHHALDRGITLIDTADLYGAGSNERLVGRLLAERHDDTLVASKFGILREPDADGLRARNDETYLRAALEASLRRLGTDHIDLYYVHRLDPRVPIEDTVGILADYVRRGDIGHIGLSEVTAAELERAHAVHPITAVQNEWSVWSRDIEAHIAPTARRLGVGVVAYSPLGRGFLAQGTTFGDDEATLRAKFPRFGRENLEHNRIIAETVSWVALREGVTAGQVALTWLEQAAGRLDVNAVAIPSTRRAHRVDENLGALDVTLSDDALAELDALHEVVVGDRASDVLSIAQGRERAEEQAS